MKNGMAAVLWAVGIAGLSFPAWAQDVLPNFRSSYPVAATKALRVRSDAPDCLPGSGGLGGDPKAARVEIRAVRCGKKIVPLDDEGKGDDENNPLVTVTRIGAGTVGEQPGKFAVCIPRGALLNTVEVVGDPDSEDSYDGFFARVYDAPTVQESLFYQDSEMVRYDPEQFYANLVFTNVDMQYVSKAAEAKALSDDDADGLSYYEEKHETKTDPEKADTDGDGLNDGIEVHAGLDPLNELAITAFFSVPDTSPETLSKTATDSSSGRWWVSWPVSLDPRVHYYLEAVTNMDHWGTTNVSYLADEGNGILDSDDWIQDVTGWMDGKFNGFFRVRVEVDEEEDNNPATDGDDE